MELRQSGEQLYSLALEGPEIYAMVAAYREHVNRRLSEGEDDSVSDGDLYVANWNEEAIEGVELDTDNPLEIAERLEEFYENIGEVSRALADGPIPPFANSLGPKRLFLGREALKLAGGIRSKYLSPADQQEVQRLHADLLNLPTGIERRPIESTKPREEPAQE